MLYAVPGTQNNSARGLIISRAGRSCRFVCYNCFTQFEWDESKRDSNIVKHGIDFADAPRLFSAPVRAISDLRQDYGEERFIGLGPLDNRVVAVAFTEPEENTIRIISLRRALAQEKKQYEQYIKQFFGHGT